MGSWAPSNCSGPTARLGPAGARNEQNFAIARAPDKLVSRDEFLEGVTRCVVVVAGSVALPSLPLVLLS